jgi:hypothetical protein
VNNLNLSSVTVIVVTIAAGGCAQTAPQWDAQFGQSVNMNMALQTLNPGAAKLQTPEAADGQAVREGVIHYRQTFKEPPPPQNVFNIGVGGSSSGASGSR